TVPITRGGSARHRLVHRPRSPPTHYLAQSARMRTSPSAISYLLIVPLALSSWACSSSSPDGGGRDASSDGSGSSTDGAGGNPSGGSTNTTVPGLDGGLITGGPEPNPCEAEDAP